MRYRVWRPSGWAEDLRAALDTLPDATLPAEQVIDEEYEIVHADAPDFKKFVPSLSPADSSEKTEARRPHRKPVDSAGLSLSGRQDSNLRPLGPEPVPVGLAPTHTHKHQPLKLLKILGFRRRRFPPVQRRQHGFRRLLVQIWSKENRWGQPAC
jgi:hypothetical protein